MNPITRLAQEFSARSRRKRAAMFLRCFSIDADTRILDLGSENGTNIFSVLQGTGFTPGNVYIADIDPAAIEEGKNRYGFNPVLIDESGSLPFADKFFDIVYCSSVIEHVTAEKSEIWKLSDGREFAAASWKRQTVFANEIERLGRQYFVQTPDKTFPIESHTWLPLVGYLPRRVFLPVLKFSNRFWVKQAEPDFNLLSKSDMKKLFPEAEIASESKFGLTKSLMAIRRDADGRPVK